MSEARIVDRHPLAIRWFHWVNFPAIALMVWSGALIYWANDVYSVTILGRTLKFFPAAYYAPDAPRWVPTWMIAPGTGGARSLWTIDHRLAEGMAWHFLVMWFFALNGLAYVAFLAISGQWRRLAPGRGAFKNAILVALHDFRLVKKAPEADGYNAAQRIAYSGVIVMGLLMLVTGVAIYKPAKLAWLAAAFGGYDRARMWHSAITIAFVGFFFVHVAQVARAGWNGFRAMITGKELVR